MPPADLPFAPIRDLAGWFERGELSPVALIAALVSRIEEHDGALGSVVSLRADAALAEAEAAEAEIRAGRSLGPLHGVPLLVKDNLWTHDLATTAHSRTLLGFIPPEDATAVGRLRAAGMIVLGKTNTTEFACGDMALFGPSRNPWDPGRYSGASSGGSAAALAAGLAPAALGSDTGGSIRAPASFCGVVGVKPTYGRVSRHGLIPLSWSMDTVGPMTRCVADAALLLSSMAGHDPNDPGSTAPTAPALELPRGHDLAGVRVGVPEGHFFEGLEPAVAAAVTAAHEQLVSLGAELRPVSLPSAGRLGAVAGVLVMAEAFGRHAAGLRTRGADYGPKARRRIAAGAFYSAAEVQKAERLRRAWIDELTRGLREVEVLAVPTLPYTAFSVERQLEGAPDTSWGTRQFNLAGTPALTLPCGFDEDGLPIGLQLAARAFDETAMFRVAHAFEQTTPWHRRRPPLPGDRRDA